MLCKDNRPTLTTNPRYTKHIPHFLFAFLIRNKQKQPIMKCMNIKQCKFEKAKRNKTTKEEWSQRVLR